MLQRVLGSYVCVWINYFWLSSYQLICVWESLNFYITFCIWSYVQAIIKSIRSCIDTVYHINLTQHWLQGSNPVGNRRKQNVKKE